MKLDATPWARAVMPDELRDTIRQADPRDAQMHVGRGVTHWRALVTWNGRAIAESFSVDIKEAVEEALDAV